MSKPSQKPSRIPPWTATLVFVLLLFGISLAAWGVFFLLSRDMATHTVGPEEVKELLAR